MSRYLDKYDLILRFSLFLLVVIVFSGCAENEDDLSLTQEETRPADEFVGRWNLKKTNGQPIDEFFKEVFFAGMREGANSDGEDPEVVELIIELFEENWEICCVINFESWVNFKSDGTYKRVMKADMVFDVAKAMGEDDPEGRFEESLDETDTGTYFVDELTYKLITDSTPQDIIDGNEVLVEEGNWSTNGKSLTMTYTEGDGTTYSAVYFKATQ